MLIVAILLLSAAIAFGVMFWTYWSQSQYKNGMLFAVRLPKEAERDRAVRRIQERFRRDLRTLALIIAATALLLFLPWMAFRVIYFLVWLCACTAAFVIPFRRANRELITLKRKNGWFVSPDGDDGDEYWSNGITYHNPKDRRIFVEKRVGMGMTVNTGTAAGKWFMGGTVVLMAAVIIGVSILFIWSEVSPPAISFVEEGGEEQVNISYILYSARFPVSGIQDLSLVEDIPRGSKTSGEATYKALRGMFRLEGIGKARLFVYRNNPPYIRIQLENETIFYNEEDPELTKKVYEQLLERRKPGT